ncbi:MAG: hypothetical protein ABIZ36_11235 [Gemmatimonadaceae bacterium]
MTDPTTREKKFNDEEVALIIKRAAELQQTQQAEEEPSNALTLAEVEQIAQEAGIDPKLIRQAAHGLERRAEITRPSPWLGAPTRLSFERVIDGELPVDEFESIINEIRRTFGDNGVPSVLGKTLAWTSSYQGGPRRNNGRTVNVNLVSRSGATTVRVEEEMRNVAGAVFGGLVGGGGGGSTGVSIGIGMGVFHSAPVAAALWFGVASVFYTLARTVYGRITAKREKQLRELAGRLEQQITDTIASRTPKPADPLLPGIS